MPDVIVTGANPKMDQPTLHALIASIRLAVSNQLPCRPSAVQVRINVELQDEQDNLPREIFAHIITGFLNNKSGEKSRKVAGRVKAAVEDAIRESLPGIGFTEAFVIKAAPHTVPEKLFNWLAATRDDAIDPARP